METPRVGTRRLLRLLGLYAGLIALFVLAMTAIYALPQTRIIANSAKSAHTLRAEGLRPELLVSKPGYRLDNYTDALMIDSSIVDPAASAFDAAMAVVHGTTTNAEGKVDPIEALINTVEGHRELAGPYAYYWHGYQVFLRPALLLTDLRALRVVNALLLALLSVLVLLQLHNQAGWRASVAFALALAFTGYAVVPWSLQYSNMTYLMLAAVLGVLIAFRSGEFDAWDLELFFAVGVLAAFFDLLTTPLLTLGMPLAVALIVRSRDAAVSFRSQVRLFLKTAAVWSAGYLAAWLTKMVIAEFVVERGTLRLAAEQFLFRAGLDSPEVDIVVMLGRNLTCLPPFMSAKSLSAGWSSVGPLDIAVGVVVLLALVLLLRYRRPMAVIRRAAHVLLVAPLPYVWFLVTSNHSSIHYYFTYRIQLMTVFAVFFVLLSAIDFQRMGSGLLYWRRSARDPV